MNEIYIPPVVKLCTKVVIVNPTNEVLLLQRSDADTHRPGTFDLVGGGMKDGETPLMTAVRETYEEVGLDIPASDFHLGYRAPDARSRYGHINRRSFFGADVEDSRPPISLDPLEHQAYDWFPEAEAYNHLAHPVQKQALAWIMRLASLVKFEA